MKFAATSDLHGDLPKIEECDALLICGDLSPVMQQRDHEAMTEWMTVVFNDWVNKLPCDKVFLIAGNHDFWMEARREDPTLWNNLSSFVSGKLIVLDNQLYDYNGVKIYGTPECQWISNKWAYMNGDVELKARFEDIPENLDILMTHQPPYACGMGTVYESKWHNEFGSFTLANAIVKKKPKYALCGHVHSGEHKPQIKEGTTYVNVSYKDESYSPAYNIFYFEFEEI